MFKMLRGIFACAVIASLIFTGCKDEGKIGDQIRTSSKNISSMETSSTADELNPDAIDTVIKVPDAEGSSKHISIIPKKFTIYTIENDQVVPKSSMAASGEKLDVKSVLDSVILELSDLIDDNIGIDINEEETAITINFKVEDKNHPFGNKHYVPEMQVLECISYSILDNFTEYKKIYFKLNGEAYISKQLKLSEKKPFMADE